MLVRREGGTYPALGACYQAAPVVGDTSPSGRRQAINLAGLAGPFKALGSVLLRSGVKGAVIRTFGTGRAVTDRSILAVFRQAVERGVQVLNVTQCPGGTVEMGLHETSAGRLRSCVSDAAG